MVRKDRFCLLLCIFILSAFIFVYPAFAEQERPKRDEAADLASEQDRIKRAQLENEQRWNDLSRKAQLTQDQWVVIDDSLSLKQAVTEVNDLKQEIANLKGRLDYQYGENTSNMQAAYAQQRALTKAKLPPKPSPKDAFKTTTEYNKRISAYKRQVKEAVMEKEKAVGKLQKEENLKLTQEKVEYTDWRMPTQDELAGLYDKAKGYKSACGDEAHLTELIRLTCYWTWASDTRGSGAACFRFGGGGYRCWGPPSGTATPGRSRCVPANRLPGSPQRIPQYVEVPSNIEGKRIISYFSDVLSC